MWSIRLSSLLVGLISFVISIATFTSLGALSNKNPIGLLVVYYVFPGVCVILYVICQVALVLNTLDDRWPLGDILFGFLFFAIAQIFMYVVSTNVCILASHYIDGLFFGEIFGLLAVLDFQ